MGHSYSPLRYPGGKQILARVLSHLLKMNGRSGGVYAEPYAGGAGAALSLLFRGHVRKILINDADPCIYALWDSILHRTGAFVKLIQETPLTIDEWLRQREVYRNPDGRSRLKLGFATFYLNRCNRSGIIKNGGPIGGIEQKGIWRVDARFNRDELAQRVERIAAFGDRIAVSNLDAVAFLSSLSSDSKTSARLFVYLDPPYFEKGRQLYLNHYSPGDHALLADFLQHATFKWALTYDNVREIHGLYPFCRRVGFGVGYSAYGRRDGREILVFKKDFAFPKKWLRGIPPAFVTAAETLSEPMPL